MKKVIKWVLNGIICLLITVLSLPYPALAKDRLFLDLSLEFLDEYQLPPQKFADTVVGGLSAIAYDQKRDQFYVLSDDRSLNGSARFYTLKMTFAPSGSGNIAFETVSLKEVTFLKDSQGDPYPPHRIDPEGLALSPRDTLFLATEGDVTRKINPFIGELERETGKLIQTIRLPQRFLLNSPNDPPRGVRNNLGFESLTVGSTSILKDDPFRLFIAPEFALSQDISTTSEGKSPIRLLHYVISPIGDPVLVSEQVYLLEPSPPGTLANGLTELVTLPKEGYWLSLERTFGLAGAGAKIFQVTTADATDTSRMLAFQGDLPPIKPLQKKLLFDSLQQGISVDNLEGMTLGPRLTDGTQSLILVSDNNFSNQQITQFLLFRLSQKQ